VLRAVRITAIAVVLAALFSLSQQIGAARGNEPVPGIGWALGVLSAIFLVRAVITERTQGPEMTLQKDLLWGVGLGGLLAVVSRILV